MITPDRPRGVRRRGCARGCRGRRAPRHRRDRGREPLGRPRRGAGRPGPARVIASRPSPAWTRGVGLVGDHGVGSNNWVVSGEHTRSGKPILANDPAPRVRDAVGLDHERAALSRGRRRLPVGRRRRHVPGCARGRPRAQRADRVGRDERQPGHAGPVPRSRPTRRDPEGHYILDGQRLAVRRPPRDDQGRRRRRRSRSTSDRPSTASSSATSTID